MPFRNNNSLSSIIKVLRINPINQLRLNTFSGLIDNEIPIHASAVKLTPNPYFQMFGVN